MPRRALVPVLLAAIVAVVVALRGGDVRESGGSPGNGTVLRVIDGDTIVVRLAGGAVERVRFIGMDTPESVRPGTAVQCFALKASSFTKQLLDGRRVRLIGDVEARDRYGRMLAYVYREPDGLFVNEELVRQGYATPATFPPNVRFRDEIARLAREARAAGTGLWNAC